MAIIRTVLGDIAPTALGPTLAHEHCFCAWLGWDVDPLAHFDREAMLDVVVKDLTAARRDYGVAAVVDATMPDLGRDVDFIADCSRASGMHIVAASGFYKGTMGITRYWQDRDLDEIEDWLAQEITVGVGPNGVRCGVLKVATDGGGISAHEEKCLRAAARASRRTGAAIISHTDPEGWAVTNIGAKHLDVLLSEGADPERCIISHSCGAKRLDQLLEVARRGAQLGFDRIGSTLIGPDDDRADLLAGVVAAGYGDRVQLGHDWVVFWKGREPRQPRPVVKDFSLIHREFLPRLRQRGVSERAIEAMLVDNPQRVFAF